MYKVLQDRKIDKEEHRMLLNFFSEFANYDGEQAISSAPILINGTIAGLFVVDPHLDFKNKVFCFTGASSKYSRADLSEMVRNLGGIFTNYMSQKVDYLVVGADGNPCWQYACYGRKIEEAVMLRQAGSNLLLVHEFDFHDAVADQS
jgi:NAD-dependent DNA ligase